MKHYQFICIILLCLLIVQSTGCKKDKPGEGSRYSLAFSVKALAYVQLTEGKYLIYKDSATQILDSVIVTASDLETVFIPTIDGDIFTTVHAHYMQNFHLMLSKIDGAASSVWLDGYAFTAGSDTSTDTATVNLREPDNTLVFSLTDSDNPTYSTIIEGKTYNNVVVTTNDNGLEINDPSYKRTSYYWAKDIGIIKRTTITAGGVSKTYTLLRNN